MPRLRRPTAGALLASALVALGLALAACGDDSSDAEPAAVRTAPNGDVFNDADVEFASGMVPHHAEALLMVDQLQRRDVSPELTALAEDVRAAQAPEIELMTDWLTAWGEPVPETARDHVNSHGGDTEGTEGMEGMEGLDELGTLQGAAFEQRWIELMVEHHRGAVEMAQAEQEDGAFADAVALAEQIERSQDAEIDRMEELAGAR